jgi:hypothetical protein
MSTSKFSKGVARGFDGDRYRVYTLLDDAGTDHLTFEFEARKPPGPAIFLHINGDMDWWSMAYYSDPDDYIGRTKDWFRDMWRRIRAALSILFTGTTRLRTEIVMLDEEHVTSLIEMLKEGREFVYEELRKPDLAELYEKALQEQAQDEEGKEG